MDINEKEKLINKILSTKEVIKLKSGLFYIYPPSVEDRYEADQIYDDLIYELSFDNWLTEDKLEYFLIKYDLWTKDTTSRMKSLEESIDNLKVDLFKNCYQQSNIDKLKKLLVQARNQLENLHKKKSLFSYTTLESYAKSVKIQYLTALSIRNQDNIPVYTRNNFWSSDSSLLFSILSVVSKNKPTVEDIREISRTDPWRSQWSVTKDKVFTNSRTLSDEQRTLLLYSKMYDNVQEHPECPGDKVIEDDDMFDGWLIFQHRKRKKEMAKRNIENKVGAKQKGAGEIFIPVASAEEAKEIHLLNDLQTRIEQKRRKKILENKGSVDEQNFPDVQMKLRQQANRDFIKKVRGK
jgi:hypothetical protein